MSGATNVSAMVPSVPAIKEPIAAVAKAFAMLESALD